MEKHCELVRAARKRAGLSQEQLATALGTSQSFVSKIEAGILNLGLIEWSKFYKITDIPLKSFEDIYVDIPEVIRIKSFISEGLFKIPKQYAYLRGQSVRFLMPMIKYFENSLGKEELRKYLKKEGIDPDYFHFYQSTLNFNFFMNMAKTLSTRGLLTRSNIDEVTAFAQAPEAHGELASGLRFAKNISKKIILYSPKYQADFTWKVEEEKNTSVIASVGPASHMQDFNYRDSYLSTFPCDYQKSWLIQTSKLKGGPEPQLEESQCHFKGASKCIYKIKY